MGARVVTARVGKSRGRADQYVSGRRLVLGWKLTGGVRGSRWRDVGMQEEPRVRRVEKRLRQRAGGFAACRPD